ncbi:hypothetical protein C2S53_001911 [Perilla frutescens var. hirtella]|uniref:Uncharacterized protein n=1 Tax=Perilla frutescens var. hirtella TaxID=608512 RepID=A0AAD4P3G4_PERFH|nr:hypothetical protein C2S53_001911 [Perilla frutescens var. hirtella]
MRPYQTLRNGLEPACNIPYPSDLTPANIRRPSLLNPPISEDIFAADCSGASTVPPSPSDLQANILSPPQSPNTSLKSTSPPENTEAGHSIPSPPTMDLPSAKRAVPPPNSNQSSINRRWISSEIGIN